ncbi:unnamed protein product [Oppiella nova]|uniref:Uncharacterized protein n=1 Tax=Oppiella nova TaxID=334625 RepID=A0A7R9QHQ0_9ACAR|nr:unnamed protein product [Oppiella nova]CAG2166190.1 unnamed protein product [Oppiella nova]
MCRFLSCGPNMGPNGANSEDKPKQNGSVVRNLSVPFHYVLVALDGTHIGTCSSGKIDRAGLAKGPVDPYIKQHERSYQLGSQGIEIIRDFLLSANSKSSAVSGDCRNAVGRSPNPSQDSRGKRVGGEKPDRHHLPPLATPTVDPVKTTKSAQRWGFPVFMTGWRKNGLVVDDLFRCSRHDESQRIVQELEKHWNNERRKKSPKFWRAVVMAFGKSYILPLSIFILGECVVRMSQPLLLGIVIDYFSKVENLTFEHACVVAGGLCFSSALFIWLFHSGLMLVTQMGMRLRAASCTLIYKKSLRLSRASLAKTTVGHIVNLMSNDVNRFDVFSIDVCYLFVAPIQTGIAVYIIYTAISYYCFACVALLLLFLPFQAFMGKLFSKVRNEVRGIQMACFLKAINLSVYSVASRILLFACFIAYVLTGNPLTAKAVFITMSLFNTIRSPLTIMFPNAIAQWAQLCVSCHRIQSSLIMSILNELPVLEGSIQTVGTISYASQEAWSFNNSIRNNILFGSEYDEHRHRRVVHVCALERDLQVFPFGDKTLVGEKGVILSGGQKARITLARALYRNSDIVLMDDPLSAVDTSVAHIYSIMEYLSDKIRILVTHQIQFIRKATQILVLSPEGRCLGLGSYDELQSQRMDFMAILNDLEGKTEHNKQERELTMRSFSQNSYDTKQTVNPTETILKGSINDRTGRYSRSTSVVQTENVEVSKSMGDEEDYSHEPKIQKENREVGSIGGHVYYEYVKAGAGPILFTITLFSTLVFQVIVNYSDLWLTKWTDKSQKANAIDQDTQNYYVYVYSGLIGALFVTALMRSTTWSTTTTFV